MTAEAIHAGSGATFGVDDIRERLARIEAQLAAQLAHGATREDIADIRTLIERRQAETMRWLATVLSGTVVAIAGTLVAVAVVLVRTFL